MAEYYPADDGGRIAVGDSSLVIMRGPQREAYTEYAPRNTGERQTHLGESCTVWEVSRTSLSLPTIRTSCVTDDGIELWWKRSSAQSVSSARATRIDRRPVSPEDVTPPASAFALNWPGQDALLPAIPPETPDHEVVLERPNNTGATSIRTVRRHGPWQYTEETHGKLGTIEIRHDYNQLSFGYSSDELGAPKQLTFWRFARTPDQQTEIRAARPRPKQTERTETVLGATCRWFEMIPGSEDGYSYSCLTEDGIALKETALTSRIGHQLVWTAIRVTRRPITIDEVRPPAELLSPQRWGIE
jgi:hypothetical protein